MRMANLALFVASSLMLMACTGQSPAKLKSTMSTRQTLKGSCLTMVMKDQILTKQNTLDIFECSGWARHLPNLTAAISATDDETFDEIFAPINKAFLSDPVKQRKIFDIVALAEARGQMDDISGFLRVAFADHRLASRVESFIHQNLPVSGGASPIYKVFSRDNSVNLRQVKALATLVKSYEQVKGKMGWALADDESERFHHRIVTLLDEVAAKMGSREWGYFSQVIYDPKYASALKLWGQEGAAAEIRPLLTIIERPDFVTDVSFLVRSLSTGLVCLNEANQRNFFIDVEAEVRNTVESLKRDSQDRFEKHLLHALTKYLGFQQFCEEDRRPQGLRSFYNVLQHSFNLVPSTHDYKFIRTVHHILGDDRYAFLDFLRSATFAELRDLMVTIGDMDEEFVRLNFQILLSVPTEDFASLSELFRAVATESDPASLWFNAWAQTWRALSYDERYRFVELLGAAITDEQRFSSLLEVAHQILAEFPEFAPALAGHLERPSFQESFARLMGRISSEAVQDDLSRFFSEKGIFEFIKIITWSSSQRHKAKPSSEAIIRIEDYHVLRPSAELTEYRTRSCFDALSANYQRNVNYYRIVNELPEDCRSVLGEVGFIGQTYLWMYDSNKFFLDSRGADDFHSGTGVWSPGMLHFFFTAAVKANQVILSPDGRKGILLNLDDLHRAATAQGILETFHLFTRLYVSVAGDVPFEPRLYAYLKSKQDLQINALAADVFRLTESRSPRIRINERAVKCSDLSAELGANPCPTKQEVKDRILEVLRMTKVRNKTTSLLRELVRWLHPKAGVELPRTKKGGVRHSTSFDEIIRFLYDLSSEKTLKPFTYHSDNSTVSVVGTSIDRMEVVLRDIAFTNNFYGAHFKNDISRAWDYRSSVISNERLLTWLDRSSGIMRRFGMIPYDTKWRLKNVRNTYWSLVELSDEYPQSDGTSMSYDRFIQSLLVAVVSSSREPTQSFNPYRTPNTETTEGHNGLFLTKVTELSGLRFLAKYVRTKFGDLTALQSEEFRLINSRLIGRHDPELMSFHAQRLVDLYLDHDRNQLNQLLNDLIEYVEGLGPREKRIWEEILVKGMLLLSDPQLSTANIHTLAGVAESVVKMWPEMKKLLKEIEDPLGLLTFVNSGLDSVLAQVETLERVLNFVIGSQILKRSDLEEQLQKSEFRSTVARLLNELSRLEVDQNLNWREILTFLLAHPDNKWGPVMAWLDLSMNQRAPGKVNISMLLDFMGEKNAGQYRLKLIFDEVLRTRRTQLELFLMETFPSLQLQRQ